MSFPEVIKKLQNIPNKFATENCYRYTEFYDETKNMLWGMKAHVHKIPWRL